MGEGMKNDGVQGINLESRFLTALKLGVDSLSEAGKLLVQLIEADPAATMRLREKYHISSGVLRTLENIGRGNLLPELFNHPQLGRMPLSEQKRLVGGDVDMLVFDKKGEPTFIKINLLNAPAEVRKQVVNGNHIRSLGEQRAYLEATANMKHESAEKPQPAPWRVVGRVVRITRPIDLTSRDLLTIQKALMDA